MCIQETYSTWIGGKVIKLAMLTIQKFAHTKATSLLGQQKHCNRVYKGLNYLEPFFCLGGKPSKVWGKTKTGKSTRIQRLGHHQAKSQSTTENVTLHSPTAAFSQPSRNIQLSKKS